MITDESGVKFFDRKFVAANLRSQLRCPKCSREYSHKHTRVGSEDNKRPFLLPCGHNMCEHCISKHRQKTDFKCAVCFTSAQPTLAAKDPNHKYVGNIRDYYELNYHVLGETNSLDYYRRYSVDSVNNSLKCSGDNTTEIIMETKCSECNHIAANGECKQCCAFYCRRCFEIVHNHSRVLKAHVLQRFPDNKRPEKGIRVGNDVFYMPDRMPCKQHNKPKTIFCYKCNRSYCKNCSLIYHTTHKTCPVVELNHHYMTEVPATIQSLDAGLLQINNAQQLVKNSKKKLGDFAAETLANISKCFRLLHGQLQNAELQTIEMLRESSLPSQMQLNVAMSQLNGYETILKNLRQMLYSGGQNDRIEVPQDIRLQDVICLANEHLEKMPTQVHMTKFYDNPYNFTCTLDNLSSIIAKHFVCIFNDPKIEIRFNNEYDRQSVISCGVNDGHNWQDQPTKKDFPRGNKLRRQPNMNSSHSSMNTSNSDDRRLAQQRELMRTISPKDMMGGDPNEQQIVASPQMGDWFRTDAIVRVRTIQSPEDFYVQCIHTSQHIREQLLAFAQSVNCQMPDVIVVGQQYITCHNRTQMDRFHRALVSQKAEQRDMYHVFLPDIGVNNQVHSSDFRELPQHLATLPYAAVHCSLKQLMPPEGYNWEPQAADFLKQLVQNDPVQLAVLRALGPQIFEVDLIMNNFDSRISVRESFLYTGLARAAENYATALIPKPQPLMALTSQRLQQYVPQVGEMLTVQMMHIQHPQEFYVMPIKLESTRYDLQHQLQDYMERCNLAQLEPIYLGRVHLACVLKWEGQWHRACILEMLPKGCVVVRLEDSGITLRVRWNQLFKLPSAFWTQKLVIQCCLADVEPLQQNGYTWTMAAIKEFKQLSSNPNLQLEVISVRHMINHVALNYTRSAGGDSVNVAAMLVAHNHCHSSGESSKVREPPAPSHTQLDADTRKLIEQSKLHLEEQHSHSDEAQTPKLNRSSIEVTHVLHPNEFYATMTHFASVIVELRRVVQTAAQEMHQNFDPRQNWMPGELCYVRAKAKADRETLWHRGQIIAENDAVTYTVRLRDIGELLVGVSTYCLVAHDENDCLMRVTNSAVRCELFGIVPNDEEWSLEAIEFFKAQLLAYSSLCVDGHGRSGDTFFVTLFGVQTVISGPFSPDRIQYTSINDALVDAGYAEHYSAYEIPALELNVKSTEGSNTNYSDEWDSDCEKITRAVDKYTQNADNHYLGEDKISNMAFQHTDEMPPLELLQEFNTGATTTNCSEAPPAWLQPRECHKSIFTAKPTNVNYFCEIYLSLASDEEYMKHMRCELLEHFKPLWEKQKTTTYVVGQPVVVIYHLDKLFYRGIVKSEMNAEGEHTVYFVDYGNEESVLRSEMLPYAPFPHLNAMCWPVMIFGVKRKRYNRSAMDYVHGQLVMKLCNVRVVNLGDKGGMPICQIKVHGVDITELMMAKKIVEPSQHITDQKKKQDKREQTLKSFKIFDELLQLGQMQPQQKLQQPAVAVREIEQRLECCEVDFDCNEAAKQRLQTSVDFERASSDDDNNEHEQYQKNVFSNNFVIEEIDEGSANENEQDDNNNDSPEQAETSFMAPHGMSAIEQVRHRFQMRYKKKMGSAHFLPMDTSTERSYGDGIDAFKPQSLPTGVNSFPCFVDKVVSAVELQITPQITEFAKQEITLAQETSSLIRDAPQLMPVQVNSLCLARFAPDNQWYRAIVKELHPITQKATVFYIDFTDIDMVSYTELKEMPKELYMFPQRCFRVKLHGLKLNRHYSDTHVRLTLQACLNQYPMVFARVHFTPDYHKNLLEVDLFEDKNKTELIYQPLINCQMYLLKKH